MNDLIDDVYNAPLIATEQFKDVFVGTYDPAQLQSIVKQQKTKSNIPISPAKHTVGFSSIKEKRKAEKRQKKNRKQLKKRCQLLYGDCLEVLKELPDNSVDSVVTDPPYGLKFMGKKWDHTVPAVEVWQEVLRVLKPGGFLLCFAGTRTHHRMCVNIEDAGFEIRDMIAWVYGSGFPKSHNISKAIDKAAGAEREVVGKYELPDVADGNRKKGWKCTNTTEPGIFGSSGQVGITAAATDEAKQWDGWGTSLKPAFEPITVARKPFKGTVAANVLKHGTGGINVDGCRVGTDGGGTHCNNRDNNGKCLGHKNAGRSTSGETFHADESKEVQGRFPANLIHDGSDEVVELFPDNAGGHKGLRQDRVSGWKSQGGTTADIPRDAPNDSGSAARFFYCAKANKRDRDEGLEPSKNTHPTVKPTELMRYLVRLVTQSNGRVLDPYMGSGSTGKAAVLEGFKFTGIELEKESYQIAKKRVKSQKRKNA